MTTIYYERDADLGAIGGRAGRGRRLRQPGPVVGAEPARQRVRAGRVRARATRRASRPRPTGSRRTTSRPRTTPTSSASSCPTTSSRCCRSRPSADSCVIVASGYTLGFGRLDPPGDSGMVAPRMLGPEVRRCYEEGVGFITAVGVHHDVDRTALDRVLAIAQGDRRAAAGRDRAHADAGSGARPRRRAGAVARARPP